MVADSLDLIHRPVPPAASGKVMIYKFSVKRQRRDFVRFCANEEEAKAVTLAANSRRILPDDTVLVAYDGAGKFIGNPESDSILNKIGVHR